MDISYQRRRSRTGLRAFTLIELLVVTAIIVVVTSIILADNNRFGGVVQLENLAYDIALSIRQAQVYGISVAGLGGSANPFGAGYGMHFDMSDPQHYELFADTAGSGIYDPSENVSPSPYTIANGFRIASLCVTPPSGTENCNASTIDIVFKRPEPDAWISVSGVSCIAESGACEEGARIVLASPRGDMMSVVVDVNGQISVQNGTQSQ
jgi:prepilin-type N-terminal cleavage/methylation domain-containing protein